MFIKIASIIEILLGLAMAGFGGFIFWLSRAAPGPTAIVGPLLGIPMILLGILLIIFGVNLWRLKKWARLASIVILVIVIAFFSMLIIGFRDNSNPMLIFSCAGAVICLILLILGKRKIFLAKKKIESLQKIQIKKRMSVPWKKILIIVVSIPILILIAMIEVPKGMVTPTIEKPIQPKTADVSMCERVTGKHVGGGEQKDLCYFHVATEIKDVSLCEKIIDTARSSDIQDQCYANIARDTKDSSLCKKIIARRAGSSWKDDCYLSTPCRSIAACVRKFLIGLKRRLET